MLPRLIEAQLTEITHAGDFQHYALVRLRDRRVEDGPHGDEVVDVEMAAGYLLDVLYPGRPRVQRVEAAPRGRFPDDLWHQAHRRRPWHRRQLQAHFVRHVDLQRTSGHLGLKRVRQERNVLERAMFSLP